MDERWLLIFADALLVFHTLLVAFVILGLVATLRVRAWPERR